MASAMASLCDFLQQISWNVCTLKTVNHFMRRLTCWTLWDKWRRQTDRHWWWLYCESCRSVCVCVCVCVCLSVDIWRPMIEWMRHSSRQCRRTDRCHSLRDTTSSSSCQLTACTLTGSKFKHSQTTHVDCLNYLSYVDASCSLLLCLTRNLQFFSQIVLALLIQTKNMKNPIKSRNLSGWAFSKKVFFSRRASWWLQFSAVC